MKQVILKEPGTIELRDIPVPEPSAGEVVIKISAALTCGTDLKAYVRGHTLIPMPGPFGHEYAGTIARTGKGVETFKEGDHVMGVHSAPCLQCPYCRKQIYNLCTSIMVNKALGAFAEYLLLPAPVVHQNLFPKPANISFEEAALLEPFSCVVHPYGKLRLEEIDSALVIGAGPIGLMHLAYMKSKGMKTAVSDFFDERLALAEKMGADRAFSADTEATEKAVREMTGGMGVDLVVECTGQIRAWESAVNYVRRGGSVVLFGGCPAGTTAAFDTHRLHYDELEVLGSFHYSPKDVKDAYHVLAYRLIDLSPLVSGSFPLQDIEKAFMLLEQGRGMKYALKP